MRRIVAVLLTCSLAPTLVGCDSVAGVFTPTPEVVVKEATVAVPGAAVEGELGDKVPDDTPLWPGAKVEDSSYAKGTAIVLLSTDDAFDDVLSGISVGFERAGWGVLADDAGASAEDSATGEPRIAVITASKPEREALVTITDDGQGPVSIEILVRVVK